MLTASLRRCATFHVDDDIPEGGCLPSSGDCGTWTRRMPWVRVRGSGLAKSSRLLPCHERCTRIGRMRGTIHLGVSTVFRLASVTSSHEFAVVIQVWAVVAGTL